MGFDPAEGKNRSGGAILGEKALRAAPEWPPNKAVAFTAMLAAAVTGAKPKMGDNATVRI